ncbi:Tn3 family transposase [Streptomyces sp. NPDC002884]
MTRPIRWELIAQQYDQMVKYATALRLGTAEAQQRSEGCPMTWP